MTHRMILVSHDFKEVKALVIARRKDAGVADHSARLVSGNTRANLPSPAPDFQEEDRQVE